MPQAPVGNPASIGNLPLYLNVRFLPWTTCNWEEIRVPFSALSGEVCSLSHSNLSYLDSFSLAVYDSQIRPYINYLSHRTLPQLDYSLGLQGLD